MNSRPDPVQFARLSYAMGFVTSGILALAFILGMVGVGLGWIVWLALVSSAAGTFMAWAARRDFKTQPPPPEIERTLKVAWRVNLGSLILMFIVLILYLIIRLVFSTGGPEQPPATEPAAILLLLFTHIL